MKFLKIALIFSFVTIFMLACTETTTVEQNNANNTESNAVATPTVEEKTDELAMGRKHYKEQCARCHKEDGTGGEVEIEGRKMKPDNLTTDKMKKMSDEKYIKYMVEGIPDEGMPSFKDQLSDEQMKDVVKFIREEIQK